MTKEQRSTCVSGLLVIMALIAKKVITELRREGMRFDLRKPAYLAIGKPVFSNFVVIIHKNSGVK